MVKTAKKAVGGALLNHRVQKAFAKADRESIQEQFADTRAMMQQCLIERDDEIDVVLTALIARENPLLVGPPGTAKSFLLDSIMHWLGPTTTKFSITFNRFSTPEEVFGPISVKGLKEDQYRRIVKGRLPDCRVAQLDEINTMVSAL